MQFRFSFTPPQTPHCLCVYRPSSYQSRGDPLPHTVPQYTDQTIPFITIPLYTKQYDTTLYHMIYSASINGILQCRLGVQKLYKRKKRPLRPNCGPILELLRSQESLFSSKCQKFFNKHILRQKLDCYIIRIPRSRTR